MVQSYKIARFWVWFFLVLFSSSNIDLPHIFYWFIPIANAEPIAIFSDTFDQDSSGLKNGWVTFSGSSAPSRKTTDSPDSFIVGLDGTKGMLLEGASGSNPDDGAERHIATFGYTELKVMYSRTIEGFSDGDEFKSEYSLDGGTFTVLETLTASQPHSNIEFTIENTDRNTKLTLRFYVNGNHANDRVGVDNLTVTGENPALFYHGFESNLASTSWVFGENVSIVEDDAGYSEDDLDVTKIWTDDNGEDLGEEKGQGISLKNDGILTKSLDTYDYKNIKIRYARRVDSLETDESFQSYYSANNGEDWTSLETINGETGNADDTLYESVVFGPLEGADNVSSLSFKFQINGNSNSDKVFIDDVVVWGDLEPLPLAPMASPSAGSYFSIQKIELSSANSDYINFTTDDTTPNCSYGDLYDSPISIFSTKTIIAIGCTDEESVSTVASFSYTIEKIEAVPLDFQSLLDENVFVLYEGTTASSTSQITLAQNVEIKASSTSYGKIILEKDLVISRVDDSSFDFGQITSFDVDLSSLAGLASGIVINGALQWGIPNVGLKFSIPITVNIFVGTEFNDQSMEVVRSITGTGDWTSDGIVSPATCTVTEGICTFQATKASYYATTSNSGNDSSDNGGDNEEGSSSGGGGGWGGGWIGEFINGPLASPSPSPVLTPILIPTPILTPIQIARPVDDNITIVKAIAGSGVDQDSGSEQNSVKQSDSLELSPEVSPEIKSLASIGVLLSWFSWRWLIALLAVILIAVFLNRNKNKLV